MEKLKRGYVEVYTGNGKGKTTSALGTALRAVGIGLKVYMVQFLKGGSSSELYSIEKLKPYFEVFNFESERGFFWNLSEKEKIELKKEVQKEYNFCIELMQKKECDILIMDEIFGALEDKLISERQIIDLIEKKPENIEIILTGRNAPQSVIDKADLVTEMKKVKHYFDKGVNARRGIEY